MTDNGDNDMPMTTMMPIIIINCANGWTTYRIAIGTNEWSVGATQGRHWRKMLHSPIYLNLLPNPVQFLRMYDVKNDMFTGCQMYLLERPSRSLDESSNLCNRYKPDNSKSLQTFWLTWHISTSDAVSFEFFHSACKCI